MSEKIRDIISESIKVKEKVLNDEQIIQTVEKVADIMVERLKNGNRILKR